MSCLTSVVMISGLVLETWGELMFSLKNILQDIEYEFISPANIGFRKLNSVFLDSVFHSFNGKLN